jgi:hypothetical protein
MRQKGRHEQDEKKSRAEETGGEEMKMEGRGK